MKSKISITLEKEGVHFFLENVVLFSKESDSPYLLFGDTKVSISQRTANSLLYLMNNPPDTTSVML